VNECIFNELSVSQTSSKQEAQQLIEQFVRATVKAKEMGFVQIRMSESLGKNLYNLSLSKNYLVSNWLNDSEINIDLKNRFRLILANPPLLKDDEATEKERFDYSEFWVNFDGKSKKVFGLGVAYLKDTLAVSLQTDTFWNDSTININRNYLNEDGNEITESVDVLHFSNDTHLIKHQSWFEDKQRVQLIKSDDLWEKRLEFFPKLVLCGEVEKQLKQIGISKQFGQIIERLRALNQVASEWLQGDFSYLEVNQTTNLRISPESEQTIRRFGNERKFKLPNGRREIHELHIKTGDLRFHFYPDNQTKIVYVGYIGKHLNTASG
jgi:hypothetical protein